MVFDNLASTSEEVMKAGENALVCMYGGNPGQILESKLRYKRYMEKTAPRT